jgi:hypothetical protein
MVGAKSEKEARLNYTIHLFARQFFHEISSVQPFTASEAQVFFLFKTFMKI